MTLAKISREAEKNSGGTTWTPILVASQVLPQIVETIRKAASSLRSAFTTAIPVSNVGFRWAYPALGPLELRSR